MSSPGEVLLLFAAGAKATASLSNEDLAIRLQETIATELSIDSAEYHLIMEACERLAPCEKERRYE